MKFLFIIAQVLAIRLLGDDFASLAALMGGDEDQLSDASVEQIAQLIASEKKEEVSDEPKVAAPGGSSTDQFTYANIDAVKTQHLHMDLAVDFDTQTIDGTVEHTFKFEKPTDQVVLDAQGMEISGASFDFEGKAYDLKFELGADRDGFGAPLTIQLPQKVEAGKELKLKVHYKTNQDAVAFSWLSPEQTLGKKQPYLFTQCQFLACRSVAPLQDTPAVKSTYSASVTVPKDLVVKMSANDTATEAVGDKKIYKFDNQIKTPSYLIALAIGDLAVKQIGARTAVITEPAGLDKAAAELDELQTYLDEVEKFVGLPYVWGTYNVLVLPPSFPFGGMENPMLTFVTPTMITGDKSQVATAIHEVGHSWMGNLVTCKSWEDAWLNESPTVYIQKKVTAKLYGKERARVETTIDNFGLETALGNLEDKPGLTRLHLDLSGTTPEAGKSQVQYIKGYQLLNYLETLIGEENMRHFLQTYVKKYYQSTATSKDFTDTFDQFIATLENGKEIASKLDWQTWIYGSGDLPVEQDFSTPVAAEAQSLAAGYEQLGGSGSPENFAHLRDYCSLTKLVFLDQLRDDYSNVTPEIMRQIDSDYQFTTSKDPKVKQRWYWLGILAGYQPVFDAAHEFVSTQGKTENLQFIYRALVDSGHKDQAANWLEENKNFYHKSAVAKVQAILNDD